MMPTLKYPSTQTVNGMRLTVSIIIGSGLGYEVVSTTARGEVIESRDTDSWREAATLAKNFGAIMGRAGNGGR